MLGDNGDHEFRDEQGESPSGESGGEVNAATGNTGSDAGGTPANAGTESSSGGAAEKKDDDGGAKSNAEGSRSNPEPVAVAEPAKADAGVGTAKSSFVPKRGPHFLRRLRKAPTAETEGESGGAGAN